MLFLFTSVRLQQWQPAAVSGTEQPCHAHLEHLHQLNTRQPQPHLRGLSSSNTRRSTKLLSSSNPYTIGGKHKAHRLNPSLHLL